ncbi:MAG: OsmC family peroxiredoxin, partial [Candidatus Dormibacteraeota bacterium]|nr:OsmC family peroxiredoxin [Candidatus Dormibacteraeota bacterium]
LFREAVSLGISLDRVAVRVSGEFTGDPAVSSEILYEVEIAGDATDDRLRELVQHVDRVAEIPNSLRGSTRVGLRGIHLV